MTTPFGLVTARTCGLTALALTVLALAACSAPAAASESAVAVHQACQRVSAVLSDGPDPTADPVGYAEAQVLPLGQIRTPDRAVGAAISRLDSAYRAFFVSNGSRPAQADVAAASRRIDVFCPGAAS